MFKQYTNGQDWVLETVMVVHRHAKFAFRLPIGAHKHMREYAVIAHKKNPQSKDKGARTGRKLPRLEELESLLGDAPHGSWFFDFMTQQLPPSKSW